MKMKTYNLPAVLLAAIAAMVLIMTAGAATAYADEGYNVNIRPFMDGEYIALPGQNLAFTADVYFDYEGESWRDDGELEYKWELGDEDSKYAKVKAHKGTSIATVTFKDLPEGQTEVDNIIELNVTVFSYGEKVASDQIFLVESSDYYLMSPGHLEGFLRIGVPKKIEAEVRHYTIDHPAGEIVKNVKFKWEVDGGAFDGTETPTSQTPEKTEYTITRRSAEGSTLVLQGEWDDGEETREEYSVLWTEEIPTDINEYKVQLPEGISSWDYFVDEGQKIDREYLEDNTAVYYEDESKPEDESKLYLTKGTDFDFVVEKYQGYDEETGLPIWKIHEGDLVTDHKGSDPDLNGEPTEGTGIYRITAKAKGDILTGETEDYAQWIYMYSNKSISGYIPNFSFDDAYAVYLDDEPWFRYDVKLGTELTPTVERNGEVLEENTDYVIRYEGVTVDYSSTEFPSDPGVYAARAEGIGEFYGTSYERYIKIGSVNRGFKVSPKTIKAKASKKTTFTAKKAFKVSGNKGTVTYEKVSGDKKITVSSAGKVTVKKGLKKGKTYKVKVKVTDSDSDLYFAVSKTVTLKVKVKK
ncbi:MAG: hypothetical protein IJH41_07075 [Eubacterium sp.]|nr:hypothetical protein [Eubacterium sp.]